MKVDEVLKVLAEWRATLRRDLIPRREFLATWKTTDLSEETYKNAVEAEARALSALESEVSTLTRAIAIVSAVEKGRASLKEVRRHYHMAGIAASSDKGATLYVNTRRDIDAILAALEGSDTDAPTD